MAEPLGLRTARRPAEPYLVHCFVTIPLVLSSLMVVLGLLWVYCINTVNVNVSVWKERESMRDESIKARKNQRTRIEWIRNRREWIGKPNSGDRVENCGE